ncbi:DUF2062 domain-containing protein [Labilithrix luteola]|uniref:DUF2062 domain-containing protein n=1 Tax=Labilithrix luteola TaxID=1391654 RepID=UPI001473530E|nr:DUF2062 domain-containing protein [Labilithrix luteola]
MFQRLWQKLLRLWALAKSERAAPRDIGWAVFIGAFVGCTPAVGVHGVLALGCATLFRKNRLFAYLGSRISNMVFLPFIALAEVQIAHRIRTGAWATIERQNVLDDAPRLLLDWCLGTIPVGIAIGGALGVFAWGWAARREAREKRRPALPEPQTDALITPRTPAEPPQPSSESPA